MKYKITTLSCNIWFTRASNRKVRIDELLWWFVYNILEVSIVFNIVG